MSPMGGKRTLDFVAVFAELPNSSRIYPRMKLRIALAALMTGIVAAFGCAPAPDAVTTAEIARGRPLDSLPSGADLALVRQDLLTTAADRFGRAALGWARRAPTHLIVKRFVGMAPPPPPGAGSDWRLTPAAALLVRRGGEWLVATGTGWRAAPAEIVAELDRAVADPAFWSEPSYTPPCPDFGASLLLLKVPGKTETVRNSTCMSRASRLVEAALRA